MADDTRDRAAGAVPTRAVDRALGLLAAFQEPPARFTLAELARHAGLATSTALRLLRTLEATGFLVRGEDGLFAPGPTLVRLASGTLHELPIYSLAGPSLEQLAAETGETANLAIRHGERDVLYLRQVPSPQAVRYATWAGRTIPLDGTAVGAALRGEVGRRGYAVARGSVERDVTGVAVPLRDQTGAPVAALSVIGPSYRMPQRTVDGIGRLLLDHAEQLAQRLAGPASSRTAG
ncbi:MAG TPA: IclR family transcriptional regulator [Conexibacter sp.]|nr:IclR family transcriptional regulator [Conexibacter sp.]